MKSHRQNAQTAYPRRVLKDCRANARTNPQQLYYMPTSRTRAALNHPCHAFMKAFSGLGTASLDGPSPIGDGAELQALDDLIGRNCLQKILLVGEDEQRHICKFVFGQQFSEFRSAFFPM